MFRVMSPKSFSDGVRVRVRVRVRVMFRVMSPKSFSDGVRVMWVNPNSWCKAE
jgi:hypothetical protein